MIKSISKTCFILLLLLAISFRIVAQDKPAPIKSATLDMLMGTWVSEPYQMMGSTWTEEATHSMKYNGQYMFIDLNGKDDKGNIYSGVIIIVPKNDGTFTGYGFDEWGGVSNATGKTDGNKIHVESKSQWGSEIRDIEINGSSMTHKITWTMKDKDGKDMTQNMTVNYKKK